MVSFVIKQTGEIMGKTIYQENTIIRHNDYETGETITETHENKHIKRVFDEEEFIQVYVNDIAALIGLEKSTDIKVMMALWKEAMFNPRNSADGNLIYLYRPMKESLAKELGYSVGTVNNSANRLAKKEFIIQKDRGVYFLNPKYFFKGFIDDRPKVMRTIIEYRITKQKKEEEDKNQLRLFEEGQKAIESSNNAHLGNPSLKLVANG